MSKLRVHSFSISIDGYGAGPGQDLENPIGRETNAGPPCDFPILERWLRDHSTIQQWRLTENRKFAGLTPSAYFPFI